MLSWLSRSEAAVQKLTPAATQFVDALEKSFNAYGGMPIYSSHYREFFVEQKLDAVVTEESVFMGLLEAIPIVGARKTLCEYIILNRPEIITSKETLSHIGIHQFGFPYDSTWWRPDLLTNTSWIPETTMKQFDAIYSRAAPVLTSASASMFSASNQEKKTNTLHENNRPT